MTRQFLLDLGNKYPTKWILVDETLITYKVFETKADALAEKNKNRWQYLVHKNNIIEFSHLSLPTLEEVLEISKLQPTRYVLFSKNQQTYEFYGSDTVLKDRKRVYEIFNLRQTFSHLILNGQILKIFES